jgi:hypothetical protein
MAQNGPYFDPFLGIGVARRPPDSYVFGPKRPLKRPLKKGSKRAKMAQNGTILKLWRGKFTVQMRQSPIYPHIKMAFF